MKHPIAGDTLDTKAHLTPSALQRALATPIEHEVATAKTPLEADLVLAGQANRELINESERQAATIDELEHTATALRGEDGVSQGRIPGRELGTSRRRD